MTPGWAQPGPGQPAPTSIALGYRPALDGVRAFAVLLVVMAHTTALLVPEWRGWVPGGFLGVDVFFVLSGFLITSILLQEHHDGGGRVSIRGFYGRRALRLLPALAVLLVVHAAVAGAAHADLGVEGRTAGAVALYGANWMIASGRPVAAGLGHLWSLSVEEQFYLLWPLGLWAAMRCRRPASLIAAVATAGILCVTGLRAWLWLHGSGWERVYVGTDTRADALLMGALLALAFRSGWRLPARWRSAGPAAVAVILVCAATVSVENGWLYAGGGLTVVGVAATALIASVLEPGPILHRVLSWGPAVLVGRASYSLYLWHSPIFTAVASGLSERSPAERLVGGLVVTAAATLCSYRFVEVPVARLRHRARRRADASVESSLAVVPGG